MAKSSAGEARSQPGVSKGSETGPMMGGLRVALTTLSDECRLLRVSDPLPMPVPKILRSTLRSCRAASRRPKVGSWAGEGGGAEAAVGLQVLLPGQFLFRFVEQIIEDDRVVDAGTEEVFKVFSQGSLSALRGAEPRCVGVAAPLSDVIELVLFSLGNLDTFCEPFCIWQSLAPVFFRQSTKAFGRISCGFLDPDPEVDSPFALQVWTLLLRSPCIWESLAPVLRQSAEAF